MHSPFRWSFMGAAVAGLGTVTTLSLVAIAQQSVFPDVQPDYWAYPFIQTLAENDIITGYPDGTFRPENPIQRDEFSAMVRQAFEFEQERQIESAAQAFGDVPQGYWASTAIEETYQMGVLGTPEENLFFPEQEMTKLDAVLAISQELQLPEAAEPTETAQVIAPLVSVLPQAQAARPEKTPNRVAFPLAVTALMFPLFNIAEPAEAQPPSPSAEPVEPAAAPEEPAAPPSEPAAVAPQLGLNDYYADADQIPADQRAQIQQATEAGLIVNYPNVLQFDPNQLLSRGGATALVYQALVLQGKLEPLPEDAAARQYIVEPVEPTAN